MILTSSGEKSASLLRRVKLKALDGIFPFFLNKRVCIKFRFLFTMNVVDKKLTD